MHLVDPGYYHKLLAPNLVGPGLAADVFVDGEKENVAFMAAIGGYTGQLWRFIPTGDGAYLLSTLFRGPALRAGVVEGGPHDGEVRLAGGDSPAQEWIVEPLDAPESFAVVSSRPVPFVRAGYARLSTRQRGPGWTLDLAVGGRAFMPTLAERSDGPGQTWLLARTDARVA